MGLPKLAGTQDDRQVRTNCWEELMNQMISKLKFIIFGLKTGFLSFIRGNYKAGLKRMILPVNYWRVTIFKIVAERIFRSTLNRNVTKILDIGSPKLLSIFLATTIKGEIYATDLQDKAIFAEWERHSRNLPLKSNLIFEFADAKKLSYPDRYFDVVYSLSVIHMITPVENGDILALREMQKKIKPGGLLIIEVPYRQQYAVLYLNRNNFEETYRGEPLFNERHYDDTTLEDRITKNIGGVLLEKVVLCEKYPFDAVWNKFPKIITRVFAFIEPWIDAVNVSIAKNERQFMSGKSVLLFYRIT